ncbi:hypothetical protein HDU93_001497 [Gonapodya sp. JEL0774]|nr:hypothetical protein HDU93_001497 [Gonapodya sp. JEL0774]
MRILGTSLHNLHGSPLAQVSTGASPTSTFSPPSTLCASSASAAGDLSYFSTASIPKLLPNVITQQSMTHFHPAARSHAPRSQTRPQPPSGPPAASQLSSTGSGLSGSSTSSPSSSSTPASSSILTSAFPAQQPTFLSSPVSSSAPPPAVLAPIVPPQSTRARGKKGPRNSGGNITSSQGPALPSDARADKNGGTDEQSSSALLSESLRSSYAPSPHSPSPSPPSRINITHLTSFRPPPLRSGVVGAPGWRSGQPRPVNAGGRRAQGGGGYVRGNLFPHNLHIPSDARYALMARERPTSDRVDTHTVWVVCFGGRQLTCPDRSTESQFIIHTFTPLGSYLRSTPSSLRRCAVCFEPLSRADLRPARPVLQGSLTIPSTSPTSTGSSELGSVELTLVRRPASSTVAYPASHAAPTLFPPPVAEDNPYARIASATSGYEGLMWGRHIEECERAKEESIEEAESKTWEEAGAWCRARVEEVEDILATTDDIGSHEGTSARTGSSLADGPAFYFYQHPTGAHLYLHTLTVKQLRAHFGDYHVFPHHLTAPVLAVEEATLTKDMRRRNPYLAHLPSGCDVVFVELDVTAVVSEDVLRQFSGESAVRAAKREERREREAKEDAWRDKEERRKRARERREWEVATGRVGERREAEALASTGKAGMALGNSSSGDDGHEFSDFGDDDDSPAWRDEDFAELASSSPTGRIATYAPPRPDASFATAAKGPALKPSSAGSWAGKASVSTSNRADSTPGMATMGPQKVATWSRGVPTGRVGGGSLATGKPRNPTSGWASDDSDDPFAEQRYLYRREEGSMFSLTASLSTSSAMRGISAAEPYDDGEVDDLTALQMEFEDAADDLGDGAGGKLGWKGGNGGAKGTGLMKKKGKKVLLVSNGGRRAR